MGFWIADCGLWNPDRVFELHFIFSFARFKTFAFQSKSFSRWWFIVFIPRSEIRNPKFPLGLDSLLFTGCVGKNDA